MIVNIFKRLGSMHARIARESEGRAQAYCELLLKRIADIFLDTEAGRKFLLCKKYFENDDLFGWYVLYLLLSAMTLIKAAAQKKIRSAAQHIVLRWRA